MEIKICFVLVCLLSLSIGIELQPNYITAPIQPQTKLDVLSNEMNTIQSQAIEELAVLQSEKEEFKQLSSSVLGKLQLNFYTLKQKLSDLQNDLSRFKDNDYQYQITKENIQNLIEELTFHQSHIDEQYHVAYSQSQIRIVHLLLDLEDVVSLSQKIADVAQNFDTVQLSAQYSIIANRESLKNIEIPKVCSNREELSNSLNKILNYLQKTHDDEINISEKLHSTRLNVSNEIQEKIGQFQTKLNEYSYEEQINKQKIERCQKRIDEIQSQITEAHDNMKNVQQMHEWMTETFLARYLTIIKSMEETNTIIHLTTLLQAKIAVRAVTTQ